MIAPSKSHNPFFFLKFLLLAILRSFGDINSQVIEFHRRLPGKTEKQVFNDILSSLDQKTSLIVAVHIS